MRLVHRALDPAEIDHERLWGWVGLAAAVCGATILATVGPLTVACPFKHLSGLPCPTCGSTRAVMALLEGEWSDALWLNPATTLAIVCSTVTIPIALWTSRAGHRRWRLVVTSREAGWIRLGALAVIAAQWCFLMLTGR
jgi:phosphatidylserine synthase